MQFVRAGHGNDKRCSCDLPWSPYRLKQCPTKPKSTRLISRGRFGRLNATNLASLDRIFGRFLPRGILVMNVKSETFVLENLFIVGGAINGIVGEMILMAGGTIIDQQ